MIEDAGLIYLLFSSPRVFATGRGWFRFELLRDGGEELCAWLRLGCVLSLCRGSGLNVSSVRWVRIVDVMLLKASEFDTLAAVGGERNL